MNGSVKNEIEELIKKICGVFTLEYTKAYALELAKKIEEEASANPSPFNLLERPERTDDIRSGYLLKEGDSFRKKWNKRFFVVKHDYFIHYYKRKEDYKSGNKPRGIIALCGYKTISDVNNGLIQRAAELAQKMGLDPNSIPKPKQYSENVIELCHPYRKSFFVQCENAEEKKDWIQQFEIVCYNINGFLNKDSVHIKAFQEAIRRTRWSLGRWEFWYDAGTEEQILTDLIASEIELDFIGKILSNLQGPWVIRNFLRNRTLKLLDVMVDSVVSPAWKAMNATVTELRTKVEPVIKEMVEPLGKAKREILQMIQSKSESFG